MTWVDRCWSEVRAFVKICCLGVEWNVLHLVESECRFNLNRNSY